MQTPIGLSMFLRTSKNLPENWVMSFKREIHPQALLTSDRLTKGLISIGFRLSGARSTKLYNIEDVLFSAAQEGVLGEDYRVLGLLVDWFEVHSRMVNVDRLCRLVMTLEEEKLKRFWVAIAQWLSNDVRFKKIQKLYRFKTSADLLSTGTEFLIKRHGWDERFKDTVLRVPNQTLRRRLGDILSPKELAKKNLFYRFRVLLGPIYRADLWAHLDRNDSISTAELARLGYANFATAWAVKRDFNLLASTGLVTP